MNAFFTVYGALPREGPGDDESLRWALAEAGVAADARVLDAGCGSGADLPALRAHVPAGSVVAMDSDAPLVARAARRCPGDAGVSARVGDMASPEGRFDLIWSAGALYFLGVEAGLAGWRDHLAPGGRVAFSQLAWKLAARPAEVAAYWAAAYPEMMDADGVIAATGRAGYRVIALRWLPSAAWLAYYRPLAARCDALAPADGALAKVIAEARAEIDIWRRHGGSFGYLQVVVEPA